MAAGVNEPLLAIVGPTASGKTGLAIRLAEKLDGEIICADSRTIYKYADVGTAKPTVEEQSRVPHWGLDLIEPNERYSAGAFQEYALGKIGEIRARGKTPLLVGGTGLYVDSVLFNFQFTEHGSQEWRQQVRSNTIVVGIATEKKILQERIADRTEQLFENCVVDEATMLGKKYGWDCPAMTGNIYQLAQSYLSGDATLKSIKDKFTTLDRQLAKRQMTWLRPNPYIQWCTIDDAYTYCVQLLAAE